MRSVVPGTASKRGQAEGPPEMSMTVLPLVKIKCVKSFDSSTGTRVTSCWSDNRNYFARDSIIMTSSWQEHGEYFAEDIKFRHVGTTAGNILPKTSIIWHPVGMIIGNTWPKSSWFPIGTVLWKTDIIWHPTGINILLASLWWHHCQKTSFDIP